jgi:hypothetical protein
MKKDLAYVGMTLSVLFSGGVAISAQQDVPSTPYNPSVEEVLAVRPQAELLINTPGFIEPNLSKQTLINGLSKIVISLGEKADENQGFIGEVTVARNIERMELITKIVDESYHSYNGMTPIMAVSIALSENGGIMRLPSSQRAKTSDTFGAGIGCKTPIETFDQELSSVLGTHPDCFMRTLQLPDQNIRRIEYDPKWPGEYLAIYGGDPQGLWGAQTMLYQYAIINTLGYQATPYGIPRGNHFDFNRISFNKNTVRAMIDILSLNPNAKIDSFWQTILDNAR